MPYSIYKNGIRKAGKYRTGVFLWLVFGINQVAVETTTGILVTEIVRRDVSFYPDDFSEDGTWLFLLNVPLVPLELSPKRLEVESLSVYSFYPTFAIGKKCARALSAGFRGRTRIHSFTSEKDRMLCLTHEMYLAYAADNGIDPGSPYETDTTQRTPRLCSVCPVRSGKATVICHTRPLWLPFIYSARVRFHWLEIEHTYFIELWLLFSIFEYRQSFNDWEQAVRRFTL